MKTQLQNSQLPIIGPHFKWRKKGIDVYKRFFKSIARVLSVWFSVTTKNYEHTITLRWTTKSERVSFYL